MSAIRSSLLLIPFTLLAVAAFGADWLTDGANPQRTAWQKDETIFTT